MPNEPEKQELRDAEAKAAERMLGMFMPLLVDVLAGQAAMRESLNTIARRIGMDPAKFRDEQEKRRLAHRDKFMLKLEDRTPTGAAAIEAFFAEFSKEPSQNS